MRRVSELGLAAQISLGTAAIQSLTQKHLYPCSFQLSDTSVIFCVYNGYFIVDITKEHATVTSKGTFDVALTAVHGLTGEDGGLPEILFGTVDGRILICNIENNTLSKRSQVVIERAARIVAVAPIGRHSLAVVTNSGRVNIIGRVDKLGRRSQGILKSVDMGFPIERAVITEHNITICDPSGACVAVFELPDLLVFSQLRQTETAAMGCLYQHNIGTVLVSGCGLVSVDNIPLDLPDLLNGVPVGMSSIDGQVIVQSSCGEVVQIAHESLTKSLLLERSMIYGTVCGSHSPTLIYLDEYFIIYLFQFPHRFHASCPSDCDDEIEY